VVRDFKFLQDNDGGDELERPIEAWNGASWMYGRIENLDQYEYDIINENHYGIRSFLGHFPSGYVITVLSITGPDGRPHTIDTESVGWGFDILNDLISVQWVRFRYGN
jgi:hypothetical protein